MEWTEIAGRLLVAGGLATLVGVERELRSKPAGLRTNIMVGIATAAFTLVGAEMFGGGDPTRVASQIVSGIGFLGGGAIFASGGRPRGITTAAAMWASAAIGMTSGQGEFAFAALITIVTLVVLWPMDYLLSTYIERFSRRYLDLSMVADGIEAIASAQDTMVRRGLSVGHVGLSALGPDIRAVFSVHGRPGDVDGLLTVLRELEGTRFVAYDRAAE